MRMGSALEHTHQVVVVRVATTGGASPPFVSPFHVCLGRDWSLNPLCCSGTRLSSSLLQLFTAAMPPLQCMPSRWRKSAPAAEAQARRQQHAINNIHESVREARAAQRANHHRRLSAGPLRRRLPRGGFHIVARWHGGAEERHGSSRGAQRRPYAVCVR